MERHESLAMTDAECWEMLCTQAIGRIALSIAALPAILPVQYYVDGNELAICLGHYRAPQESMEGTVVAFATDVLDISTRSGWSVQVQGRTTFPRPPGLPTQCGSLTSGQIVHLAPVTMTGYRLSLCPFVSPQTQPR